MGSAMVMSMGRQLTVGPALQKSLKFLQMNTLDFARELQSIAQSNPLLEVDDEFDPASVADGAEAPTAEAAAPASDDPAAAAGEAERPSAAEPWGKTGERSGRDQSGSDNDWMSAIAVKGDLRSHLRGQITDSGLTPKLETACQAVIESIDERGYLCETPAELGRSLREQGYPASDDLIEQAAQMVRTLEPAGVGAYDLGDCLTLQLNRLENSTPALTLATEIASNHLEMLAQGDAKAVARETGATLDEVRLAIDLIKSLDPTPGREFDESRVDYIVPELAVRKVDGQWCVQPTGSGLPKVRINEMYAEVLSAQKPETISAPIKEKLQEARWLIRNMDQREQTIMAVGQAIVARQAAYFEHGEIALKPMTLADVAADIEMHESTVSRVVSSKYMACPTGLKPMKMFFTSHVQTNAGDACSATAVKAMIKAMVSEEPAHEPYSDHKLADLLSRRGVRIARRTVSKYRQAIGVRSFELRREVATSMPAA